MYEYVSAGRTSLSKATKILLVDITPHVECADSGSIYSATGHKAGIDIHTL